MKYENSLVVVVTCPQALDRQWVRDITPREARIKVGTVDQTSTRWESSG